MALAHEELLRRLHATEDSYTERKTVGDHKDWVKTIVAFANGLDPSQEGVLFIGATDAGAMEKKPAGEKTPNLDKLQKTLTDKTRCIYPQIYFTVQVLTEGDQECLAVIVPGSPSKPHFAGELFVRNLSKTVVAEPQQYEMLLASRIGKAHELQKWIGREITVVEYQRTPAVYYEVRERSRPGIVETCNQFYVSIQVDGSRKSSSLEGLAITYDDPRNRLKIERTLVTSGDF